MTPEDRLVKKLDRAGTAGNLYFGCLGLLDVLYGGRSWARDAARRNNQPAYRIQWSRRLVGGVVLPATAETKSVGGMKR